MLVPARTPEGRQRLRKLGSVFVSGQPSSTRVYRARIPIRARHAIALGSVFAPEEPSSNQVNRPQDPIRPRLSIALQLTSSISWLSSSITRNNRGGMFKFNLGFNITRQYLGFNITQQNIFFLVLNQKLMSWSFKTHGRGNRTSGWSF